jgi:hypothetical protein
MPLTRLVNIHGMTQRFVLGSRGQCQVDTIVTLQKTIIWTKKLRKIHSEWKRASVATLAVENLNKYQIFQ